MLLAEYLLLGPLVIGDTSSTHTFSDPDGPFLVGGLYILAIQFHEMRAADPWSC
jgi:hypothetical protein